MGSETPLLIRGATIIDGVAEKPIEGQSIWIEEGRIKAIGARDDLGSPSAAQIVDAHGQYVIPGLMNANVHLLSDIRLELLASYFGRYEELILEAAQIALQSGLTTVFDTWGPRRALMGVRESINTGKAIGSRIFCAGNIIGFDGPLSADFFAKAGEVGNPTWVNRINATWVENTGRHLMWLTPAEVAKEVRAYTAKGIDFIKYGSNEHAAHSAGAFLAFSERVQAAIVEEAHRAGLTAQAHSMSVEGLRMAVEAGCDLVTHCNITGPVTIPESTLESMAQRKTGAVIFPWTRKALDELAKSASPRELTAWAASDKNARNLIRSGAPLLMANDGNILAPEVLADYKASKIYISEEDGLFPLATGHFAWFKAMEEKECPPMEMLRAATRNVAVAYGKDRDLGTLEPGKIADLLVLERNPLEAAAHYRSIRIVIKDGAVVDRDALPVNPILTRPLEKPTEEEAAYVAAYSSSVQFPACPTCLYHR